MGAQSAPLTNNTHITLELILYLSVEQLKNITCMVREVATTEENATKRDGEFILSELYECLEGASCGEYSPYDLK